MASGTRRMPRARREKEMLDAAISIFAQNGYHNASMDNIAKQAGISKPMLYLYFDSKEELFKACVEREANRFLDHLRVAVGPAPTPRRQLEAVVNAFLTFVDSNPESWEVVYRQAAAETSLRNTLGATRNKFIDMAGVLLKTSSRADYSDSQVKIMATALVGAGEAIAEAVASGEVNISQSTDMLMQLAWLGLAGEKNAAAGQQDSP